MNNQFLSFAGVNTLVLFLFLAPLRGNDLEIQLFDNQSNQFCSYTDACTGDAVFNFKILTTCSDTTIQLAANIDLFSDGINDGVVNVEGEFPNFSIAGNYGIGAHRFIIVAADNCGGEVIVELPFEIVDCLAPVPECIPELAVEFFPVMPVEGMTVFVTDFLANGNTTDCSGIKGFSIHKVSDLEVGSDSVSFPHPFVVMNCDDESTSIIRIYAWDDAFNPYAVQPDGTVGGSNYDYCEALVLIQNSDCACMEPIDIVVAGEVSTVTGNPVEDVAIDIEMDSTLFSLSTNELGQFAQMISPGNSGTSVRVTPTYDVNPKNGVTVSDMILIAKHILGVAPLLNPYQLIAADVDHSGVVSTLDIIHIRRLLLGQTTGFPNNTSWRFVAASFDFNPLNSPLDYFPESITLDVGCGDYFPYPDFIAVKIGDVNGNTTN